MCGGQGMVTTWAIALHNIPEGLAVALVAVPRGESKWTAAAWAGLSLPLLHHENACTRGAYARNRGEDLEESAS